MMGSFCLAAERTLAFDEVAHRGSVASRAAGGPLCWKSFCAARGWFVTSQKAKQERCADGISVNCGSCLDGGVLRWRPEEEQDAVDHQMECIRRGEVISLSEFATRRFHPFVDVDLEKSESPDTDTIGIRVAQIAQRELSKFFESEHKTRGCAQHSATTAIVLSAPPKELRAPPSYAVSADCESLLKWYKKGFHIVFPDVVTSVHEWKQFLAAVAFACDNDVSITRDPKVMSPWFKSIDVACGPNLRAPFSDKKIPCAQCTVQRKEAFAQRKTDAKTHVRVLKTKTLQIQKGRSTSDLANTPQEQGDSSDDMSDSERYVVDDKEALRMLKELVTPEGKHRNNASKCDDPHCLDGYIPEHRPYTVLAVVSSQGDIDDMMTQRLRQYPRKAYQLATIRAPNAKMTCPPFRVYEAAPSIEDALHKAGKSPHWAHAGTQTAQANKSKNSRGCVITDQSLIAHMLKAAKATNPCFVGIIPEKVMCNARKTYYVLYTHGEASRYCLNLQSGRCGEGGATAVLQSSSRLGIALPGMHRSDKKAYFYFCSRSGTISQKCRCLCNTLDARVSGKICKQYASPGRPLSPELKTMLFGTSGAQQTHGSFILTKPSSVRALSTQHMMVRFSDMMEMTGHANETAFSIVSNKSDASISVVSDGTCTPIPKLLRSTTTNDSDEGNDSTTLDSSYEAQIGLPCETEENARKRPRSSTNGHKSPSSCRKDRSRAPTALNVLDVFLRRSAQCPAPPPQIQDESR